LNLQLRRVVVVAIVAVVTTALPTPAVTTTEFKPKEVLEKLKKTCFSKATRTMTRNHTWHGNTKDKYFLNF